jgi:KipI family sensor histidine kinase inhibitor
MTIRLLPVGSSALLVELDDAEATQSAYRAILALVQTEQVPPVDVVPAARTVLIDGIDPQAWRERLAAFERLGDAAPGSGADAAPGTGADAAAGIGAGAVSEQSEAAGEVVVPLRYDGPDLGDVAAAWGCEESEVVERHQAVTFTVAFCGFAPGFAYCTSGGALPTVARRDQPRTRVPAGAVGLAGEYCGVYPRQMPGGWQLIGTTDVTVFDPDRDEPALLQPGTLVRFEATS